MFKRSYHSFGLTTVILYAAFCSVGKGSPFISISCYFRLLFAQFSYLICSWSCSSWFLMFSTSFRFYLCDGNSYSMIITFHNSITWVFWSLAAMTCCDFFSLPQWMKLIICQLLHLFLCKFYVKYLLWFFLASLDVS